MKAVAKLTYKPVSYTALPRCLSVLAILLTASLATFRPLPAQVPEDEKVVTNGDLNLDGVFDILDLIQLGRAVFPDLPLPDEEIVTCDVDGDKKLTFFDLLVISDAYNSVQSRELGMFEAIEVTIQKDAAKGGDNVETWLDLARFYRKEERLEKSRRVLEMVLETLDPRHSLYEIISNLMVQIDNDEGSQHLMEEVAQKQLFRAEDDLGGKTSLRSMVLQMKGKLSDMMKTSQFASNFNSKKVKGKLNAVMKNMLHKLGKDQMVDPADFTRFNEDVRSVLEDPAILVQTLNPEQRNRLFGEVDRSTSAMWDKAMQLRQKVEQQETARAEAENRRRSMTPQDRLDRRDLGLDRQRQSDDLRIDRKIVANPPKITPDTTSMVTPLYTLEWDVSNVLGAKGVVLEISHKNQKFQNPRGIFPDEENQFFLSSKALTTISGKRSGNAHNLEGVGNYQYRLAALNANGEFMSRFSDATELVVVFNNVNTIANKPIIEPNEVTLDNPQYIIRWDVSNVEEARGAAVEISKPDVEFSNPNGRRPDLINQFFYNPTLSAARGMENSSVEGLAGPGTYLFRVGAISPQGDFIGRWSDPVTLIIGSETAEEEKPAEVAALVVPDPPQVTILDTAVTISWDVSEIAGVNGIILEVSPVETDSANPEASSGNKYNQKITEVKGSLTVNNRDLKGEGDFNARIALIDSTGTMRGLWSLPTELIVYESLASARAQAREDSSAAAVASPGPEISPTIDNIDLGDRKKLKVTKKSIILYKDKSISSPELATLNQDYLLFLMESDGIWYRVSLPEKNKNGWVLVYDVEPIEE